MTPGKHVLSYIYIADGQEIFTEPKFFCKRKKFLKRDAREIFIISLFKIFIRGKSQSTHHNKKAVADTGG